MNQIRRRMIDALQKPAPEMIAIIEAGTPKAQAQGIAASQATPPSLPAALPSQPEAHEQQPRPKIGKERELENAALVPVYIRLPGTIPPALLKAATERKIKKIHPFTQQDIVAEALTAWLQKNGYKL